MIKSMWRCLATMGAMVALSVGGAWAQKGPQDNWVIEPDLRWGTSGSGGGQLSGPRGIAVDTQFIYVADYGNHRVAVFNKNRSFVTNWGSGGAGTNQFNGPSYLAVDGANVFVTDKNNNRVQVLGNDGAFLRRWGSSGTGNGQFNQPMGIAVDTQYVYVVDMGNHRIQMFEKDGTFVRAWGSQGSVSGQFNEPRGVAVDAQYVYVVELYNYRVQVFTKTGAFVRSWVLPVSAAPNGTAVHVEGIGVDAHTVYVSFGFMPAAMCGWEPHVIAYDKQGSVLWKWARVLYYDTSYASGDAGPFTFPGGIAVDNPLIYVSDSGGHFVQPLRRIFRTLGPLEANPIPLTDVLAVNQRSGLPVIDVDYVVADGNDATVTVYAVALAMRTNAAPDLNDVVPMRTFVEGTASNVGPGIITGVPHRLSWDATADGLSGKIPQYGNLKVALLAKDNRGLMDLHFLQIPAVGTNVAFKISRDPLLDKDFLPLWFWLLGAGDAGISLSNGQVLGVGGAYNGQQLAQGTNTTAAGRAFLFERLDVRGATATEMTVAREGGTPGSVTQWDPRREPPAAGSKVNAFNFITEPTNGWWVVPLIP